MAGERFLRGLKDTKILAGYCSACDEATLPPRMYCVRCYSQISRYVPVRPRGKVVAMAKTAKGQRGESLDEPVTFAYVTFEGVTGGLLHRILGEARAGDTVRPVFKSKKDRQGSILDIKGFRSTTA